ncbi:DMT family transporter [Micrococcus sp.]|uniref:EamA family transporter n=1 Tax=Micrococcus sp. TaxID=1271 RepID=UPI0026DC0083|nr:EamA family transporter [Micrococcus sp.]MDO4239017.1 EamA family transporter [Micrococcus sp.]
MPASAAPPALSRSAVLKAAGLILVGSLGIQLSSAASAGMFDALGPAAVSSLRMVIAAVVLLVMFRPRLRGRTRQSWLGVVVYGVAMAAMNLSLYAAIERLPLGVAVTLDFLGPCAVALLASRHLQEGLCALLALGGVVLIAGPSGYFDLIGYAFGLSAAFFFALYTVFAEKVGKDDDGLAGLALSVTVAAVASLPFGLPRLPDVTAPQWGMLTFSALIGVVLAYTVDTVAAAISSARVVGTLFSIDPVMGSLVGAVVMGEVISLSAWAGIVLVSVAGALLVWISGRAPRAGGGR